MQFSKHTEKIQILKADLLQTQILLLKTSSPSLALFATNISNPIGFLKKPEPNFTYSQMIVADKDSNSKIRSFYYCLLHLIYECELTDVILGIQLEFKKFTYNEKNRIIKFPLQEIPTKYRQFYDGKLLMKIFIQFLQIISLTRRRGNLYNLILKYPIIDFIIILIFRSYLANELKKAEYLRMCNQVSFECLMYIFKQKFNVPIKKKSEFEYLFEINGLLIKEESQYFLIREEKYFDLSNFKDQLLYAGQEEIAEFQINIQQRRPESQASPTDQFTPKFQGINNFNFKSIDSIQNDNSSKLKNQHQDLKQSNINEISFCIPIASQSTSSKFYESSGENNKQSKNYSKQLNIKYTEQFDILINEGKYNNEINNNSKKSKTNELLCPTIQEAKNEFEYNVYDGVTSQEVMKFLSPKTIEGLNKQKQKSIQNIYKSKLSQKQIIKQKIQKSKNQLSKHKRNKRYSMISPEQIQELFCDKSKNTTTQKSLENSLDKNRNYNQYNRQSKTEKKTNNISEDNQTNNTIRLSHQTQQASWIVQSPKIKLKYKTPSLLPTKTPQLISSEIISLPLVSEESLQYFSPKNRIIKEQQGPCANTEFYNLKSDPSKKFTKPKKFSMQEYTYLRAKQY